MKGQNQPFEVKSEHSLKPIEIDLVTTTVVLKAFSVFRLFVTAGRALWFTSSSPLNYISVSMILP